MSLLLTAVLFYSALTTHLLTSYDVVVVVVEEVTFFAFQRHDANRERHDTVYEKVSAILTISLPIAPT